MNERLDGRARDDDRRVKSEIGRQRRPYAAPELITYGTVAKLTQGFAGSGADFAMMMMLTCL